jgi:hypothetical protein
MSELLKASEVASVLHVGDTCVRNWIKNGILDAIVLPGKGNKWHGYRIKRETLNKVLNNVLIAGD